MVQSKYGQCSANGQGLDWDPGHRKQPTVTPRVASKGRTPVKAIPPHHSDPAGGATANTCDILEDDGGEEVKR